VVERDWSFYHFVLLAFIVVCYSFFPRTFAIVTYLHSHRVGFFHSSTRLSASLSHGDFTFLKLREAMLIGESEREGGMSPHTSPMAGASEVSDGHSQWSVWQWSQPSV
jgi:hypothetical protein